MAVRIVEMRRGGGRIDERQIIARCAGIGSGPAVVLRQTEPRCVSVAADVCGIAGRNKGAQTVIAAVVGIIVAVVRGAGLLRNGVHAADPRDLLRVGIERRAAPFVQGAHHGAHGSHVGLIHISERVGVFQDAVRRVRKRERPQNVAAVGIINI